MADLVGDRSTAPPIAKSHVIACLLNLMHSSDDRRRAHRRMVQLFRERRPKGGYVEKLDAVSRCVLS